MKFLKTDFSLEESNVVVFGVPLGKNSLKALDSLRCVSQFVEPINLDSGINLLENIRTVDIGDIKLDSLEEVTKQTKEILEMNKTPLIIGGNHLLSLYSLKAFEKDVKLIVFDAHADFKDSYDDEKIREMNFVENINYNPEANDATWLRRLSETINPRNILLLGIRSCDEFEFNDLKKSGINFFTSRKIKDNLDGAIKFIETFTKDSKVYISIDVDFFDPSIAPAVKMPEPDGLFFNDFQKLVDSTKGKLAGTDVCCLNPISNNEITEFLVVRSLFEVLSLIKT